MEERRVIKVACNDKVIDISEILTKTVILKFCLYNDIPWKKKPASARDLGDGTPNLCVHVSKDLCLASNLL